MKYKLSRLIYISLAVFMISCFWVTASLAVEGKQTKTLLNQKKRTSVFFTQTEETTGYLKWIMTVHASGQKYHILDSTILKGPAGEVITMDQLAVPCEAEITYEQLNKGARNALMIEVKKNLPGASVAWPSAVPE